MSQHDHGVAACTKNCTLGRDESDGVSDTRRAGGSWVTEMQRSNFSPRFDRLTFESLFAGAVFCCWPLRFSGCWISPPMSPLALSPFLDVRSLTFFSFPVLSRWRCFFFSHHSSFLFFCVCSSRAQVNGEMLPGVSTCVVRLAQPLSGMRVGTVRTAQSMRF